ncbi:MAG: hypothetical protein HRU29_07010 [Rhizobiales bacterium]|nr:hypothetical protein [Hyphomicrobiales bacterium]NRB14134.1 hypothetical protein [Hyphomicrobiales bacterium]
MQRLEYTTPTNAKTSKQIWASLTVIAAIFFGQPSHADETVFWVDSQTGVAMAGFDPTSYFLSGIGFRGSREYEYYWKGAVWRFQNEGNLLVFRGSPLTYAPQFGGHGATKMAANLKVSPNPKYSDVYENRLYLFHSKQLLDDWNNSKRKFVKSAQVNWLNLNYFGIEKNFVEDQLNFAEIAAKNAEALLQADAILMAENQAQLALQKDLKTEMTIDEMAIAEAEAEQARLGINGSLNSASRMGAAGKYFKDQR